MSIFVDSAIGLTCW